MNDFETAKWLSQTLGQETIGYTTTSVRPGDMKSTSHNVTGRDLMMPDEIMQIPPELQLLKLQGMPSIKSRKIVYWQDWEFEGLFGQAAQHSLAQQRGNDDG